MGNFGCFRKLNKKNLFPCLEGKIKPNRRNLILLTLDENCEKKNPSFNEIELETGGTQAIKFDLSIGFRQKLESLLLLPS